MSFVPDTRWRAFDSNGDPISGATLTIYTAGTTTPASIFRDAALVTPMSNPTALTDKSDAAGYFPQIFAASNGLFDILLKNASGSTVASYLNVPTLGGSTGGISLDLTGSRFGVRNSGGTVYIEVGDPTGDDVGGTGNIGGWLGTQADLITINAALLNVIGRIKENSYKLPGVVRSEAVVFTAVSSVDIPLTNDPTGTLVWDIDINALDLSTTGVGVTVRFSYDGGANYVSTSTYYSMLWMVDAAGATQSGGTLQDAQSSGQILSGQNTTAPVATSGQIKMRVSTPDGVGVRATTIMGNAAMFAASAHLSLTNFAVSNAHGSRATHVRLICGTGTFSGVYRVLPQRGFGEV